MKVKSWFHILKHAKHIIWKSYQNALLIEQVKAKNKGIVIGDNVRIVGNIENLKLGKNVRINPDVYINLGGECYGKEGVIEIGDNTIISNKSILFAGGGIIKIGANCDIGSAVSILAHVTEAKLKLEDKLTPKYSTIEISNNVHIGTSASIYGDTKIGAFSQIASSAVLSGIYNEKALIMGNPARSWPRM